MSTRLGPAILLALMLCGACALAVETPPEPEQAENVTPSSPPPTLVEPGAETFFEEAEPASNINADEDAGEEEIFILDAEEAEEIVEFAEEEDLDPSEGDEAQRVYEEDSDQVDRD